MIQGDGVYVGEVTGRGKGVFAGQAYRRDDIVFVVEGPLTTRLTPYTVPIDEELAIDPVPVDNFAAYINHSCEPNVEIRGTALVVAFRDIHRGEEVVIDYAMIVDEYGPEIEEEALTCRCGRRHAAGGLVRTTGYRRSCEGGTEVIRQSGCCGGPRAGDATLLAEAIGCRWRFDRGTMYGVDGGNHLRHTEDRRRAR